MFLCFQILGCNKDVVSPIDENIPGKKRKPRPGDFLEEEETR